MSNLRTRRTYKRWTASDKDCILEMRKAYATIQEIADHLDRSYAQVAKQISRMKKQGESNGTQGLAKDD